MRSGPMVRASSREVKENSENTSIEVNCGCHALKQELFRDRHFLLRDEMPVICSDRPLLRKTRRACRDKGTRCKTNSSTPW